MSRNWNRNWNRTARMVAKEMNRERLLRRMGLEERSPTSDIMGGLGLFALGLAVGAGIGLMFAPRTGTEMRNVVGDKWRSRMNRSESDLHIGGETPSSMMP